MPITHAFVSAKSDGPDATLIRPSNWNAVHIGADATMQALIDALAGRVSALEGGINPPSPGTRMFALPVTTATYTVPSSIEHTGATNVTTALNNYFATVPNGSIINFAINGAVYKISSAILLAGRNNLIFEGNGYTTLDNIATPTTADGSYSASTFWHSWVDTPPNHITIRNFISTAHNPSPGTFQTAENGAFAYFMGGTYLEVSGIVGTGYYGDFVSLNENPSYVWVHGNTIANAGRQASASIMCGHDITIEDNTFGPCGYTVFDIEPNPGSTIADTTNVIFRRNACGTWVNTFMSVDGVTSGRVVSNVLIDSNTITGDTLATEWGQTGSARMSNIVFTNNTSNTSGTGPILIFRNVDGLTVTGNTQPHSGTLVSTTSCTSTNIQSG